MPVAIEFQPDPVSPGKMSRTASGCDELELSLRGAFSREVRQALDVESSQALRVKTRGASSPPGINKPSAAAANVKTTKAVFDTVPFSPSQGVKTPVDASPTTAGAAQQSAHHSQFNTSGNNSTAPQYFSQQYHQQYPPDSPNTMLMRTFGSLPSSSSDCGALSPHMMFHHQHHGHAPYQHSNAMAGYSPGGYMMFAPFPHSQALSMGNGSASGSYYSHSDLMSSPPQCLSPLPQFPPGVPGPPSPLLGSPVGTPTAMMFPQTPFGGAGHPPQWQHYPGTATPSPSAYGGPASPNEQGGGNHAGGYQAGGYYHPIFSNFHPLMQGFHGGGPARMNSPPPHAQQKHLGRAQQQGMVMMSSHGGQMMMMGSGGGSDGGSSGMMMQSRTPPMSPPRWLVHSPGPRPPISPPVRYNRSVGKSSGGGSSSGGASEAAAAAVTAPLLLVAKEQAVDSDGAILLADGISGGLTIHADDGAGDALVSIRLLDEPCARAPPAAVEVPAAPEDGAGHVVGASAADALSVLAVADSPTGGAGTPNSTQRTGSGKLSQKQRPQNLHIPNPSTSGVPWEGIQAVSRVSPDRLHIHPAVHPQGPHPALVAAEQHNSGGSGDMSSQYLAAAVAMSSAGHHGRPGSSGMGPMAFVGGPQDPSGGAASHLLHYAAMNGVPQSYFAHPGGAGAVPMGHPMMLRSPSQQQQMQQQQHAAQMLHAHSGGVVPQMHPQYGCMMPPGVMVMNHPHAVAYGPHPGQPHPLSRHLHPMMMHTLDGSAYLNAGFHNHPGGGGGAMMHKPMMMPPRRPHGEGPGSSGGRGGPSDAAGGRLNARQRRTLRRATERALREAAGLTGEDEGAQSGGGSSGHGSVCGSEDGMDDGDVTPTSNDGDEEADGIPGFRDVGGEEAVAPLDEAVAPLGVHQDAVAASTAEDVVNSSDAALAVFSVTAAVEDTATADTSQLGGAVTSGANGEGLHDAAEHAQDVDDASAAAVAADADAASVTVPAGGTDMSHLIAQLAVRCADGGAMDDKLLRDLQVIQDMIGALNIPPASAASAPAEP